MSLAFRPNVLLGVGFSYGLRNVLPLTDVRCPQSPERKKQGSKGWSKRVTERVVAPPDAWIEPK